jgi:hypothetical protein
MQMELPRAAFWENKEQNQIEINVMMPLKNDWKHKIIGIALRDLGPVKHVSDQQYNVI